VSRVAVLALLALALSACGSADDATPDARAPVSAPEPATSVPIPTASAATDAGSSTADVEPVATAALAPDALAGRMFVLDEAVVGGEPRELAAPILLTFGADRLGAYPGCNPLRAGYRLDGDAIELVGDRGSTMVNCLGEGLVEQDGWFARFLQARPTVRLDGDAIELVVADTVLRGRTPPDLPLAGTPWSVMGRLDGTGPESAAYGEPWMEQSQLTFEPGGRLQGFTRCGHVEGRWEADATGAQVVITLEPRRRCSEREERTLSLLSGPLAADMAWNELTLTRPDGSGVILHGAEKAPPETATTG
jgi:heat shock protein HslJ